MKEEQFFIIGAEQTTNSKSLLDFTFPLKSVLLLGFVLFFILYIHKNFTLILFYSTLYYFQE